jgi:hypothetical protein
MEGNNTSVINHLSYLKKTRSVGTGRLRLSDKKDLIPSEISVIAQRLIKNDSVVYALDNRRLNYENLTPSKSPACNKRSIEVFRHQGRIYIYTVIY